MKNFTTEEILERAKNKIFEEIFSTAKIMAKEYNNTCHPRKKKIEIDFMDKAIEEFLTRNKTEKYKYIGCLVK